MFDLIHALETTQLLVEEEEELAQLFKVCFKSLFDSDFSNSVSVCL